MKDNRMGKGRSQRPESGSRTDKPASNRRFSGEGKTSATFSNSARPANSRYGDAKPSARKRAFGDEGRSAYEKPAFRKSGPSAEGSGAARRTGSFSKPFDKKGRDHDSSAARFDDKKPFRKPYADKGENRFGDKPTYNRRPDRDDSSNNRKSFGDKPDFNQRPERGGPSGGRRKPYGEKPLYEQRPERESFNTVDRKKPYGDKTTYNQRPDREGFSADKKSFGNKPSYRERENFAKDKRSYGEKTGYGQRPERRDDERNHPHGDKPTYNRRPEREGFSEERKPYNENPDFDRSSRPTYKNNDDSFKKPTLRGRKNVTENKFDDEIRLNRYIANAGICSRRKADELILAGVVSVNGEVVNEMGFKVDPSKDEIRYNGELLKREKKTYVLLNKPKDYLTTTDDPHERRTVMQLITKATNDRIYPIGRLDRNTTGLLLMTNDGDLAEKLSHPRNNVTKIYLAELDKNLTQGDFNKIQYGVELEDGFVKPDEISYVQGASKREVGIQIHSGKNRIVRRIFEHLGYDVVKLDRTIYANLNKKDLPRGRWRYLTEPELIQLKHFVK